MSVRSDKKNFLMCFIEPRFNAAVKCRETNCRANCAARKHRSNGRPRPERSPRVERGSIKLLDQIFCPLRNSSLALRWGSRFVITRIHHHPTSSALAVALGAQIFFFTQRQVHDSPLARGHRSKTIRLAGTPHVLRRHPRRKLKLVDSHGAKILAIKPYLLVLAALQMQNFGCE